jgi:hypothetical protein
MGENFTARDYSSGFDRFNVQCLSRAEAKDLVRIIRAAMQIEVQPFRNEGKAVVP